METRTLLRHAAASQRLHDVFHFKPVETYIERAQLREITEKHFEHIKMLADYELLAKVIPYYIQSQPLREQQQLLRRSKRWILRYWDKKTQKLKHQYYLAMMGELGDLSAHLFVVNYACDNDFVTAKQSRTITTVEWSYREQKVSAIALSN